MLQQLGEKTAFIGKVGDDFLGRMLRDAVSWQGINISNLVMDKEVPTTLAFVHTVSGGQRSFSFWKSVNNGRKNQGRNQGGSRNGEGRRGVDFL